MKPSLPVLLRAMIHRSHVGLALAALGVPSTVLGQAAQRPGGRGAATAPRE